MKNTVLACICSFVVTFSIGILGMKINQLDNQIQYYSNTKADSINPLDKPYDVKMFEKLRDQTVKVSTPEKHSFGSGVTISTNNGEFVLTCAHIFRLNDDDDLDYNKQALVFKYIYDENGFIVDEVECFGTVVCYSGALTEYDLALIKLDDVGFVVNSTVFTKDYLLPVGSIVYHCGNSLNFINTFTRGIVSGIDREVNELEFHFDQITAPGAPGSSGCGIYDKHGRLAGIYVKIYNPVFGVIVPIRTIRQWADDNGISFIYDPKAVVPDFDE